MLLEPRWDSVEFERLRSATEASIIAAEGDAGTVANNAWRRVVYGSEHPFGRPSTGTRESIAAMMLDDLRGGALAGAYLAGLGHTRIAHVTGPERAMASDLRLQGCREALRAVGAAIPDRWILSGNGQPQDGERAIQALLNESRHRGRRERRQALARAHRQVLVQRLAQRRNDELAASLNGKLAAALDSYAEAVRQDPAMLAAARSLADRMIATPAI